MVFETGMGFWNPLMWLAAVVIIGLIAFIIRAFGVNTYNKKGRQSFPFFSGNVAPEESIRAGNIYWGFFEAMQGYYSWLKAFHTGLVNDYVFFFVLVIVVLLAAVLLEGGFVWA